ncbi:MAG: Gfo/Idh/MocA family oxidoreductase [Acidobacteriota bacterium]|nr:MAG: Gfo/Idh/MocA family oxidoreductase [Acidobacteriota bacterium]
MSSNVGIAILGTGFARRVQIPAFVKAGGRIVSVASASIENAKATADECGADLYTDDWRQAADREGVDLVCITTPPIFHKEMTLYSLERGKHVLCEKPMAMDLREAEGMASAADSTQVLSLIDHELRFQPGRLLAKKMIQAGHFGEIRHVRSVFQAPHRGDAELPWNWWYDEAQGGGALGAIASHIFDSLHWFLETDVADITCRLHAHIKERKDEDGIPRSVTSDDECNALLSLRDGAVTKDTTALVAVSMTQSPDYVNRMEFFGTKGSLRVEHRGEIFVAAENDTDWQPIEVDLGESFPGVPDTGFARAFATFAPVILDAVRRGDEKIPNAATFADGVRVQKVIDAARLSDREGRTVNID